MAVHASHAALPYPIKGARYSILVPYLDADGDPTVPTTPDTEISEDNAAATDAAEEASATSGMDGMALITFSGAETDCSCLAVNAKVASGPKATLATLYPRVLASVGTGTLSAGSAGGGTLGTLLAYDVTGCFIKTTGGTGGGGTGGANNQARKIVTYNTSTGAFTVTPNWETTPSTDTTYEILLPEGVTLGMLKALNPTTAGRTLTVESDGMAHSDLKEWLGVAPLALTSQRVETLVGAMAANTVTASAAAADFVAEVQAAITGGAYDLDTDANGRIRIVDGTAAGEINTNSGAIALVDLVTTVTNLTNAPTAGDLTATMKASVNTEMDNALADINLDHLMKIAVDTDFATTVHLDSVIGHLADAGGTATFDRTADSLEILGAATAPSEATIAAAVWDSVMANHLDAGSTGEALNAAGSAGDPWVTALPGAYGSGSAGFILGTNLNATVSSRASQASLDTVDGIVDSILAIVGTTGAVVNDFTTTALTELRTSLHGGDWAASMDSNGRHRIVDGTGAGEVDTDTGRVQISEAQIDQIVNEVWDEALLGHSSNGTAGRMLSDVHADAGELQTDLANGGRLDLIFDAIRANTEGEWIWLDPDAAGGGDGSPGAPFNTFASAYAAGQKIKFVPGETGFSSYTMPTITLSGGLVLDLNGWRTSGWQNVTFGDAERIFSSIPGGRIIGTDTITMGAAVELEHITVDCTTFTFKYGYFKDVFFNCNITFVTHAFAVTTDFYTCWWDGNGINTSNAHSSHIFNLLGCYGTITLSGLKPSQVFSHYGWGDLSVLSATGGTIKYTSHIEITDATGGAFTRTLISEPTPWNSDWDQEVESEMTDALNVYDPPTAAELTAGLAALNDIAAADVWAVGSRTLTALGFTLDSADTDTSFIEEIRNAITGGAYALDTDANGRQRVVDGTGIGELDTALGLVKISGTIQTLDALDTAQDTQHTTTQAAIAALNNIAAGDVLTQIETALNSTTRSMPGQATPSATPTLVQAIMQRYQLDTNPMDQDSTTQRVYNRAGTVVQQKRAISELAGVVDFGALVIGP